MSRPCSSLCLCLVPIASPAPTHPVPVPIRCPSPVSSPILLLAPPSLSTPKTTHPTVPYRTLHDTILQYTTLHYTTLPSPILPYLTLHYLPYPTLPFPLSAPLLQQLILPVALPMISTVDVKRQILSPGFRNIMLGFRGVKACSTRQPFVCAETKDKDVYLVIEDILGYL